MSLVRNLEVISDKFEVYRIYNTFICSSHKQEKKILGQEIRLYGFFSKFLLTADNVKLSVIVSLVVAGEYVELSLTYLLTYLLTPCSRILLEKLTGFQVVKKFHYFMETVGPLPHSPVPILSQLDPVHNPTSHILKIPLYVILPSVPGSPQLSLSLRFPHQNPVYASPLPHTRYMPHPSYYSRFYHPNIIERGVQIIKLLIM